MNATAANSEALATQGTELCSAIAGLVIQLKREYQRGINRDLSQHQWQQLFSRNVLAVVEVLLSRCCEILIDTQFAQSISGGPKIDKPTRQHFTETVAKAKDELIEHALQLHRSSCALSNFPEEHNPSAEYFTEVLTQVEQRWHEWCALLRL